MEACRASRDLSRSAKWRCSLSALALALAGCGAGDAPPTSGEAQQALWGAPVQTDPFFAFLPPLAGRAARGGFDAGLSPVVEVCELAGDACAGLVERFDATTSPAVRVRPLAEWYVVRWGARRAGLDPQRNYRIRALVEGTELGRIDLQPVECVRPWRAGSTLCGFRNLETGDYAGLRFGGVLPVRFRIYAGSVFAVGPAGRSFDADGGRVQIDVPPGSVTSTTGITVRPFTVTSTAVGGIDGTAYDLGPDGATFDPPLSISIAYDPAAIPAGVDEASLTVLTSDDGIAWTEVPSTPDPAADRVTGQLAHFTYVTVAAGGNTVAGAVRLDGGPAGGVTVFADTSGDGVRDAGEPAAVTAADGTYRIDGVSFFFVPTPGGGSIYVGPNVRVLNPDPTVYEIVSPVGGVVALSNLPSNLATGVDFELATRPVIGAVVEGTILDRGAPAGGVTAYADLDRDGVLDPGEPTAVSSSAGLYRITGIPAGATAIRIVNPDPSTLEVRTPVSGVYLVGLLDGDVATGRDFALDLLPGPGTSVSGTVYVTTAGPLAGVTVFLDLDFDGVLDPGEPSQLSGAAPTLGQYRFAGLPPGPAQIRVLNPDPATYFVGQPTGGVFAFTLGADRVYTSLDFALIAL